MSQLFESPISSYLGQIGTEVDIYPTTFDSVKVTVSGGCNYLSARDAGISFALSKKLKVEQIFLYADQVEKFKQYAGDLPGGLSFDMSRAEVRKVLGEPSSSEEAGGVGIMANEFSFDHYQSDTHYIRLHFTDKDAQIRLITIGEN